MSPFEITWRRDFHHVIPFQYCNCRRTCVILPMRHARDATRHWNINNVRKNSLQNKYSFVVVLVILSWSTFLPFPSVCDCDMSHLTMLWIYLTFKRPNEVKLLFFFSFFTLHISIFFKKKKDLSHLFEQYGLSVHCATELICFVEVKEKIQNKSNFVCMICVLTPFA